MEKGLKIISDGNGGYRRTWHCRLTRAGQKQNINLKVEIKGTVPTTTDAFGRTVFDPYGKGDEEFTRSREAALAAMVELKKVAKRTGDTDAVKAAKTADIMRTYYRAREGRSIRETDTMLKDLPKLWVKENAFPAPSPERLKIAADTFMEFTRFARDFAIKNGGRCETLNEVTPEIVDAYFTHIRTRYAWETTKSRMTYMKSAYKRWATSGAPNPFAGKVGKMTAKKAKELGLEKIPRTPLGKEEITRLFEVSRDDKFFHQLFVCAAATGMRLGDVCTLQWLDVDMAGGTIGKDTNKTGTHVVLTLHDYRPGHKNYHPMFGELRRVLEERLAERKEDDLFVFPEAAERYTYTTPNGEHSRRTYIVRGAKQYFARACFPEETPVEDVVPIGEETPPPTVEEVVAAIRASKFKPGKAARVEDTFRRFMNGESYGAIEKATGRAKGVTTDDLRAVEELIGRKVRHGNPFGGKRALEAKTRKERTIGRNAGCVYGWHSLRSSFVILALNSNIPAASVAKAVGHGTIRMTLRYFRPTTEIEKQRVSEFLSIASDGKDTDEPIALTVHTPAPVAKGNTFVLKRAAIIADIEKRIDAVILAAGVDPKADPEKADALMTAAMVENQSERVTAVAAAAMI